MTTPQSERRGLAGRMSGAGMPAEKSKDFGTTLKRLFRRFSPVRTLVIGVVVATVVSAVLNAFGPMILGWATNTIVDGITGDGIDFGRLGRIILIATGAYGFGATLTYSQALMVTHIVQRTMKRLRTDVESKLHRLPLSYVDGQARGDLLSRVTNDIDNIAQAMQQTMSQFLSSLLSMVAVFFMMLFLSPILTLIMVVVIPVSMRTVKFISSRSASRFIEQWRRTGALNGQVEEAITGHMLVKVYGKTGDTKDFVQTENDGLYEASRMAQFISGLIQPAIMFIGNLSYIAVAVIGGLLTMNGSMTIGGIQAFIQYTRQFTQPLSQLASMANMLQSGVASAERVFEFIDAPEEVETHYEASDGTPEVSLGIPKGRVEFDNVSFAYQPDTPIIDNVSLVADVGETIAIVGPTGSGKTTLVNLLLRFYEIDKGQITIDGVDIATISRQDLRQHIGMVLQDAWIFQGSIYDNIAYGKPTATEDEVIAAAQATYVDRFVRSLPHGYDTQITDDGGNLSAGERQLITIARAFLSQPSILILDEATSSVDTRTEVLVQHAMHALRSGRTSFVIAHRLSTIRDANRIVVMEAGRIVEEGNHDELIAHGGAYAALYQSQFEGTIVSDAEKES